MFFIPPPSSIPANVARERVLALAFVTAAMGAEPTQALVRALVMADAIDHARNRFGWVIL